MANVVSKWMDNFIEMEEIKKPAEVAKQEYKEAKYIVKLGGLEDAAFDAGWTRREKLRAKTAK